MTNRYLNTLLILLITVVIAGAGYYQVEVRQPESLQQLDDAKKLARLQQAELEQLFAEEATSAEMAEETMRRWRARYKHIPGALTTAGIIQYLESLSSYGFEQFQTRLMAREVTPDFSNYLFDVSGTASYTSLYQFVWHIENNRSFYQINDLDLAHTNVFKTNPETGVKKRFDMVNFSMKLKVFYAAREGLSAPQDEDEPVEVPDALLPARQLAHNSFYPIVRTDLPPNDELLLDIEDALLLSIAGDRAVFQDKNGQHILREGDAIYLGQIVKIDPINAMVRASLNRGGVIDIIDIEMDVDASYKQATRENTRLVPSGNNQQNQ